MTCCTRGTIASSCFSALRNTARFPRLTRSAISRENFLACHYAGGGVEQFEVGLLELLLATLCLVAASAGDRQNPEFDRPRAVAELGSRRAGYFANLLHD